MTQHEALAHEAFKKLIARRRALLRLVPELAQQEQAERESAPNDWIDRAVSVETETLLKKLADTERKELTEIDAALERIANHQFGVCEGCGRSIPKRRLEALPEARTCVACGEERERVAG
ncbi:MAG: TraR/DksA family transcriptional regulator [Deltaproteobacteria bacterium]|nr:TraR/DksA family transcriptional regulator [Deltaproteobacteria bacterium]